MAAESISYFPARFSEAEYRALEADSPVKHEFFDGHMHAMAGASARHNDIAAAALASLYAQLRGKACLARGSDQRVKIAATGLNTYPDIVAACPPLLYDDDGQTLLDAAVLIEVLSRSTADFDKDAKFAHYSTLSSLRHDVLISQDVVSVEHRSREIGGDWRIETFTSLQDEVQLQAINCRLSLRELYERLDF